MPPTVELEMMARILLAAVLGGAVGLEREVRRRPAGLRTFMLVSIGAALFTVASIHGFPPLDGERADTSRVAAQIVTGIGFIGAGLVLRRAEGIVTGLTTAASMWTVAAVGLAAGAGLYWIAVFATALVVAVLYLVARLEEKISWDDRGR